MGLWGGLWEWVCGVVGLDDGGEVWVEVLGGWVLVASVVLDDLEFSGAGEVLVGGVSGGGGGLEF